MKERIVLLDAGSVGDDCTWPDFASLGDVTRYEISRTRDVVERAKDATILLTNKVYLPKEILEALPHLRYVGCISTGYNQVDLPTAAARGITVCNVPAYSTASVMQHTFALILDLASKITMHVNAVEQGQWEKSPQFCFWLQPAVELAGKTLGVVGFGDTGSAVARMGHAFGMNVLAYAPRPKPLPEYTPFAFVGIEELFAQSDVVSLHCPSTPQSREMVNAALLSRMKPSAFIVNTARGDLIQERDLRTALEQGTIAGAGLDVVSKEPMPADHILHGAPNCLITPHIAWSSVEARNRLLHGVYTNLCNFLKGSPTNVVK